MNNFKKLLASAMALSMVTSVLPTTGVKADYTTVDIISPAGARNFISKLNKALDAKGVDYTTVAIDTEISFDGATESVFDWSDESNKFVLDVNLANKLKLVVGSLDENEEEYKIADYLLNLADALNAMVTPAGYGNLAKELVAKESNFRDEMLTVTAYNEASKLLENMVKVEAFEGNLPENREAGKYIASEAYLTYKEDLANAVEKFESANFGDILDKYISALEDEYETFVNVGNDALTKKSIEAEIKAIKAGKGGDLSAANYRAFGDYDAVEEIMSQFEALIDGAEDAAEALNKKNESTVAYNKKASYEFNGETVKTTVKALVTGKTYSDLVKGLNSETFAVLEDYWNDVVTVVYELDAKQYGNVYVDKSSKTIYVTKDQKDTILGTVTTKADADEDEAAVVLTTISDKEEGTRYFEDLAARMEAVQDDLAAITTDLKGITVNNLSSKNIDKVEAAEEALERLYGGKYSHNLTAEETATVKSNRRHVQALVDKMYNDGLASEPQTEWVDLGNGNWDYYVEGKAFTGWVCTAKDTWYYTRNGHMLRNAWVWRDADSAYYVGNDGVMVYGPTTVDGGYALDANGLWHR